MKFYTYKKQVPLKPGEKLGYVRGRGYYAVPALVPPPSPFTGKGLFTTNDPRTANGLNSHWVALQADDEGNTTPPTNNPGRVMWWQARATRQTARTASSKGIPYIGQAENQPELDACLAVGPELDVPKALVGNAGAWTAKGTNDAIAQGWDYISEWYMNAHPWETAPTGHNYPRFVNVCFGIYSEGEPGGQGYVAKIPIDPYLDVWHGSFSVWKSEAMTDSDRARYNAA